MERKTITIYSDVRDQLDEVKKKLKLSNDSDTIKFLLDLYNSSEKITKKSFETYVEIRK